LIRTTAMAFALLLIPGAAGAQQAEKNLGLDLSAPEEKKNDEKKNEDEATPPPPAEGDAPKPESSRDSPLQGERDVTVEDRVKSVQRKLYLKKDRFELAAFATGAVNDPFFWKYGATLRPAWYAADTLAFSLWLSWMRVDQTSDATLAKRAFSSWLPVSRPQWVAIPAVEWSPIYGKISIWNEILHFDSYVVGGVGVVITETSGAPEPGACGDACPRGPSPAAELGVGIRFVARDYLAFNAALINTSYVDIPTGFTIASTQNAVTLNAGISVFFPFKSTAREAE
jgi:outer membrane beta-barrel protein